METEKIIYAEIYKKDGSIGISIPNENDTLTYELYGFLKVYLKKLEENLLNDLEDCND